MLRAFDVEAERPLPGQTEIPNHLRLQRRVVAEAGGLAEFERAQVVVDEQVGQVFGPLARLLFDPGGGLLVPLGAAARGICW